LAPDLDTADKSAGAAGGGGEEEGKVVEFKTAKEKLVINAAQLLEQARARRATQEFLEVLAEKERSAQQRRAVEVTIFVLYYFCTFYLLNYPLIMN